MTAKTKTAPKPEVRFAVTFTDDRATPRFGWDGSRFAHFTARAVVLGTDRKGRPNRAVGPNSLEIDHELCAPELCNLVITAQMDEEPGRDWYVPRVEYQAVDVDLLAAETMVKVLRKVSRAMDREKARWGAAPDLVTFATRAARAFTDDRHPFLRDVPEDQDIEGTGYRSMDADQLRYWLDRELAEWRKLHGIGER